MSDAITRYSAFKDVFNKWRSNNVFSYHLETVVKAFPNKFMDYGWEKPIGEITANDLKKFFEHLAELGQSNFTLKDNKRVLSLVFEYAIDSNIIENNPFEKLQFYIRVPKYREIVVLSTEEIKKILNFAKQTRFYNVIRICLYTGFSDRKIVNLTWNDINFENHTIKISNKDKEIDDTVVEFFLDELKIQYDFMNKNANWRNILNYVFTSETGEKVKAAEVKHVLEGIGRNIGIDKLNANALNDYYIITALRNGVSPKTICDQLDIGGIPFLREYIRIANITNNGIELGNNVCLTNTLYERYIKNNA